MESFSSFFGSQDSLKNFPQFSPQVQTLLKQVYLLLCCGLVASGVGAYLHIFLWDIIGGPLTILATMACSSCLRRATFIYQEQNKVLLFMASAFFHGASIGPSVQMLTNSHPSILVSALMKTAIAFGCFSGAAVLARRRKEYLYLGGVLSSGLSNLFWMHFLFTFGDSLFYFGLLVHVVQLVVSTQEMVEKAHVDDLDYVRDTSTLFTDFVFIFIITVMQLKKNSG